MTKQELRKIFLEKRINLSLQEKKKSDILMLEHLQHLHFSNIKILMSYFPIKEKSEPNTYLFSDFLKKKFPLLQIAFPKINSETNEMEGFLVNEKTIYKKNNFKISEPVNGKIISPKGIDLVFVPLIICDSKGFRVGFGKGYYDKYLQHCRENILKIGFSYFALVEEIIDVRKFDIPLNYCITPHKIYEF